MTLNIFNSELSDEKIDITKQFRNDVESLEKAVDFDGNLYLGYPILYSGGSGPLPIDAILIDKNLGVIIFNLVDGELTSDRIEMEKLAQEKIRRAVYNKLNSHNDLSIIDDDGNYKLSIKISTITYAPNNKKANLDGLYEKKGWNPFAAEEKKFNLSWNSAELKNDIAKIKKQQTDDRLFKITISVIQDILNLRSPKKRKTVNPNSRGAKLNVIEEHISTLDPKQENAIISSIEGIQRIRGLAGSGKTVVLALKVALYHSIRPNDVIAITFHSRSLKQAFERELTRNCYAKNIEPNWNNIKIIQAWGAYNSEGLYREFCNINGLNFLTLNEAKRIAGNEEIAFETACKLGLEELASSGRESNKIYDVIFVDEAQDLSKYFLRICQGLLKKNKDGNIRLVYAYDELQKLDEGGSLPSAKEIFGVELKRDDILSVCYRNSKEVLTTAHALGFGIYRKPDQGKKSGMVQFFDDPNLWNDIGYSCDGELLEGSDVTLFRSDETSPSYFKERFNSDEFIHYKECANIEEQAKTIAAGIKNNLKIDELLTSDILVIYPTEWSESKEAVNALRVELNKLSINSYIAGGDDPNIFLKEGSITIAGKFRAKGNEAGLVYILNSHLCYGGEGLQGLRNSLFTSITRSKAWVNLTGIGGDMQNLIEEVKMVKEKEYKLTFNYPTNKEISEMKNIYGDIGMQKGKSKKDKEDVINAFIKIIDSIKRGDDSIENYSGQERSALEQLLY